MFIKHSCTSLLSLVSHSLRSSDSIGLQLIGRSSAPRIQRYQYNLTVYQLQLKTRWCIFICNFFLFFSGTSHNRCRNLAGVMDIARTVFPLTSIYKLCDICADMFFFLSGEVYFLSSMLFITVWSTWSNLNCEGSLIPKIGRVHKFTPERLALE